MNAPINQLAVVVPVFNDAENLRFCLAALTNARGRRNATICVVDDESNDATADVVRDFDVRYIRNDSNLGQSASRNIGVRSTRSEYVLFVDSDVVVCPDCFAALESFLAAENPSGVIGLQGVFSLEHPHSAWSSLIYNTLQHLLTYGRRNHSGVNTSLLLIRRSVFEQLGGFREDLWFMEDTEIGRRAAAAGWCFQHGTVEFVHRKNTTWRWLINAYVTSGKMLHALSKERIPDTGGRTCHTKTNGGLFKTWLVSGVALAAICISAPMFHFRLDLLLPSVALVGFLLWPTARTLSRVRRHPGFLVAGLGAFLLIPWLIVFGMATAAVAPLRERERNLWKGKKLSTSDRQLASRFRVKARHSTWKTYRAQRRAKVAPAEDTVSCPNLRRRRSQLRELGLETSW